MNRIEYLIKNYTKELRLIYEDKSSNLSAKGFALELKEEDSNLADANKEGLRKSIKRAYLKIKDNNHEIENKSETIEGPGYSENLIDTDAFEDYCKKEGLDRNRVKSVKYINHNGQQTFNVVMDYKDEEEKKYSDIRDELISEMKSHSFNYKKINIPKKKNDGRLLVIGLADLHIGQLSSYFETHEVYNPDIAVKMIKEAVVGLLDESESLNITEVLIPLGGDSLNVDTPKNTTTSGTAQDNVLWYDAYNIAKKLYIDIIEEIMKRGYHIIIKHIVANHDYMSSFMLSDSIYSWFSKSDIDFDIDLSHRKYYKFGKNMISINHGDGAKKDKLALLAANEFKHWGDTTFRYIYTQHIHHQQVSVDEIGVTIQSLRTPTAASGWAHRNGYQHAQSAITGFVHDKEKGQINQINYNF